MKDLVKLLSHRPKDTSVAAEVAASGSELEPSCADDYTTGFTANDQRQLVTDI
jgi:hypothetical protein